MTAILVSMLVLGDPVASLVSRLDTLRDVTFSYRRIADYKAEGYHDDRSWQITARMTPDGKPPYGHFRIVGKNNELQGFDGRDYWVVDSSNRVMVTTLPKADWFDNISALRNNIFGLARSLKASSPTQFKHLSDSNGITVIEWDCGKARPTVSVAMEKMEVPTRFRLEVDSKTSLPSRFVQFLETEGNTITTEFSKWNLKPKFVMDVFKAP